MRFEDERYVRLYTRDTIQWIMWPWEARALFTFILRKVDRAGVLEVGEDGLDVLANYLNMPLEIIEMAVPILLESGSIEFGNGVLLIPNFIEAQESLHSDASRQRDSRERRRDLVRRGLHPGQKTAVIYFIQSEHGGPIKIGHAEDVARRMVQLQTSRPDRLVLLAAVSATVADERRLHDHFAVFREKGEWFSPHGSVTSLIAEIVRDQSLPSDLSRFVTSPSVPSVPAEPPKDMSAKPSASPGLVLVPDPQPTQKAAPVPKGEVGDVWVYYIAGWAKHVGGGSDGGAPVYTTERGRMIASRMKEGRTAEDLKAACDGLWSSDHHMGKNEQGTRYTQPEQVFKSAKKVEMFMGKAQRLPSGSTHKPAAYQAFPGVHK